MEFLKRPLRSRKFRVALATVITAFVVERFPSVTEEMIYTILGIGAALILGIAHEDNGAKAAGAPNAAD